MAYLTVSQLESVPSILASWFPSLCTREPLPNLTSAQGRRVSALRIASGGGSGRRGFLAIGGLHAREFMNPDAIVELACDLVFAYLNGTGITYGSRSWSATDIKTMVETLDIWFIPCANPDGRDYAMYVDDMWRMNRRTNTGSSCRGVDVNRNFDITWGTITSATSCNVCAADQTYCGPAAFSEPESRNIRDFLNAHRVDVFVDVHSYSELILYPWGHAVVQTTNPAQNFSTLASGTCAPLNPPTYKEYIPAADLTRFRTVAQRVADSVHAVRGRTYTPEPVHSVYATGTSGTSSDYAYSRHLANPALRKTYGFAFETGNSTGNYREDFHPSDPTRLANIKLDAKAAILTLIQQSICAIEFVGVRFVTAKETVSSKVSAVGLIQIVRDETLATTKAGRAWIDLFERLQAPLLGAILADEKLTAEAVSLFEHAAAMVESDSAVLSAQDVARARSLLQDISRRIDDPDVLSGIAQLRKRLRTVEGQTTSQIVAALMQAAPRPPKSVRRPVRTRASRRH
jgi:murein tripeptide amidase MpaA